MGRVAQACVVAAIVVASARAGAEEPCYPKTMPGRGPAWHAAVGVGVAQFPLQGGDESSSLETQLGYGGYELPGAGGAFSLSLEWTPAFWVTTGVEVDYQMYFEKRSSKLYNDIMRVSGVTPRTQYSMHILLASWFVQPSLRLLDVCKGEGFEMGIRVSAGFGGLFWGLRDEIETGVLGRIRLATVYSYIRRGFVFSVSLGVPFYRMTSIGPLDLSHGWTISFDALFRVGYRW